MELKLEKAPESSPKKWIAIFTSFDGSKKTKRVGFGAKGYEDYTIHKDKLRRERYRIRHLKDLHTGDFTKAGYLSFYILWGDSTSLRKNISTFKKKFGLVEKGSNNKNE